MSSDEYLAFLAKQADIIDRDFRPVHAQVLAGERGAEHDPGTDHQSAYLVSYKFDRGFGDMVERYSAAIAATSPAGALVYGRRVLHTTISDHSLTRGYLIDPGRETTDATLRQLVRGVQSALFDLAGRSFGHEITFGDILTNAKTVSAMAEPSEGLWNLTQAILVACREIGLELKGSWGSHMTLSRFTANAPANECPLLAELLRNPPVFGVQRPTAIRVGYFNTTPTEGFDLHTYAEFPLI